MVVTQDFVCSVGSIDRSYTGRSFSALYFHIYHKHKECEVINQWGSKVILQSHADVTESCTNTADAELLPDSDIEPEIQG